MRRAGQGLSRTTLLVALALAAACVEPSVPSDGDADGGCFVAPPVDASVASTAPAPCTGPIRFRAIDYTVVLPDSAPVSQPEVVALAGGARLVAIAGGGWERGAAGLGVLPDDGSVISYGERPGCLPYWGPANYGPPRLADLGGRAGAVVGASTTTFDGRWSAGAPLSVPSGYVQLCEGAPLGVVVDDTRETALRLGTFDWRTHPPTLGAMMTFGGPTSPPDLGYATTLASCQASTDGTLRVMLYTYRAATPTEPSAFTSWVVQAGPSGAWSVPVDLGTEVRAVDFEGDLLAIVRSGVTPTDDATFELSRVGPDGMPTELARVSLGAAPGLPWARGVALDGDAVLYLVGVAGGITAIHWDGTSLGAPWVASDVGCPLAAATEGPDGPWLLGSCGEVTVCDGFDPRSPP